MKKILGTILIISGAVVSLCAQDKLVELKQLKQDVTILVKDSTVNIFNGSKNISFRIRKEKDKRHYEFANPGADSNAFYELLSIDKTEINDKYNVALPDVSAAQQLITVAANEPAGIKLSRAEEGGIPANDDTYRELGGKEISIKGEEGESNLMLILISGLSGLISGIIIMLITRKKAPAPIVQHEDYIPAEDVIEENIAADVSIDKLTAQVKKYREENRKLKAEFKKANKDLESKFSDYKQHDAFLSTYFNNVFNEFVKPFNEAIDKNDQQKAFQMLFNMSAQLSSLTKHELRVKQSYDTNNIAYVLKENNPNLSGIETVVSSTPKDNIPKNIRTIIEMMEKAGIQSLGQSIFYGYKIQKDK